jgi:hypothetical protein
MRTLAVGAAMLGLALLAGEAVAVARQSARAQETGVAEIHSWVKVGHKTCMLDHFHDGSGTGPTRAMAERAAIRAWVEFTAWEYGSPWGRYSIAASRKATCSQEAGAWRCAVEARPCRPY